MRAQSLVQDDTCIAILLRAAAFFRTPMMYSLPCFPFQTAVPGTHRGNARKPCVMSMKAAENFSFASGLSRYGPAKISWDVAAFRSLHDHRRMSSPTHRSISGSRQCRDAANLHGWAAHTPDEGSDLTLAVRLQPLRNVAAHNAILQPPHTFPGPCV